MVHTMVDRHLLQINKSFSVIFRSFIRPSVMRRASCMGSQERQILLIIPPHFPLSPLTMHSHFSSIPSHFSPLHSQCTLTFPISSFTPPLALLSFLPYPLSHFTHLSLALSTLTFLPPPLLTLPHLYNGKSY